MNKTLKKRLTNVPHLAFDFSYDVTILSYLHPPSRVPQAPPKLSALALRPQTAHGQERRR